MNRKLKEMINEQFSRTLNERKRYMNTRALVEQIVRESLMKHINEKEEEGEKSKDDNRPSGAIHQCQAALSNPTINMAGLIGKIPDLPHNPDSARSELSKWARGEMDPSLEQATAVIHSLETSHK